MGADQSVAVDVDGAVATVTLAVPALTLAAKQQLLAAVEQVGADDAVRAVVLTGTGSVFCAGQDLREHAEALRDDPRHAFDTIAEHYNPIVLGLTQLLKPAVAAINGTCAGAGLSLALACDLRVCSTAAKLTTAFTGVGLSFDSGLSATLARAVGAGRAAELTLLAEPFTAAQALGWGLVGRLAEPGEVLAQARALAARLAAGPTLAYAEVKRALWQASPLSDVLAAEHAAQARLAGTADHRNAVDAFLAKQRPHFEGR